MSASSGDGTFLQRLELDVRAELAEAESSQPVDAIGVPPDRWLFDPADAQREDVGLRSLLGAVQALEGDQRPGGGSPTEAPVSDPTG